MVSLIFGFLSWGGFGLACCCSQAGLVILASSATAVVTGHLALIKIGRSAGKLGGREKAILGLLVGWPAMLISATLSGVMFALLHGPGPDPNSLVSEPGRAEVGRAVSTIATNRAGVAHGNSPEAIALAREFSAKIKTLREAFFTAEKRRGFSLSDGEFITWCELRDGQCAFVVHVPSYRKFTSEAKDDLEKLAWLAAQQTVRGTLKEGDELAVGMHGAVLWGEIMVGTVVPAKSAEDGIVRQGTSESLLFPFFASAEMPATENP